MPYNHCLSLSAWLAYARELDWIMLPLKCGWCTTTKLPARKRNLVLIISGAYYYSQVELLAWQLLYNEAPLQLICCVLPQSLGVVSDSVVGNQLYWLSLLLYVVPWESTAITIMFKWEITLNSVAYTKHEMHQKNLRLLTIASMHVLGMFCCVTYCYILSWRST